MDEIFKLLVDVHSDWQDRFSNVLYSGLRYGCDCGCGGNTISEQLYQEYSDDFDKIEYRWQTFLSASGLNQEEASLLIESLDYLEDMPVDEEDNFIEHEILMSNWQVDIMTFGPTVLFYMLDLYRNKPNIIKDYYENI